MQAWFGWRKKISIRIIFQSFIGTKDANHFINAIIKWFYIFIANRPVITKAIDTFSFKIFGAKPQGDSSPVICSASQHSCTPPHPVCACCFCIGLFIYCPAIIAGIKITKGAQLGRSTTPRTIPGIF